MAFSPEDTAGWNLAGAFTRTDALVSLAACSVLALAILAPISKARAEARLRTCSGNLQKVSAAILAFAQDHESKLPGANRGGGDPWWWYKDEVKPYLRRTGPASPDELVFACPLDRGYSDPGPFFKNPRFNFTSYVFNGVTLPGTPNIAGWNLPSVVHPRRTLLVMEWAAHGPLSWHKSKTGQANAPFYRDAESVAAYVDGHVSLTKMYYDGYNAAYTRDPIPGYEYKFSGK